MSRSTGLPQHLLVVDLRPERAERIIGYARQAGLAVRTTRAESLEQALRHIETSDPDMVIVSFDGPAEWSFEEAMSAFARTGHRPMVVADRLDDVMVARAYGLGAQGVLPGASSDALVAAMRWGLSVAADRRALSKAESIQAETATREETLLDSSRDPVAYIHEGMHIRANHAYLEFFGIEDAEEIESLPFLDLVAPQDATIAKTCLKAATRGDIPPEGLDLLLVSAAQGPQPIHVEISKAAYEGEPCLQITLRMVAVQAVAVATEEVATPAIDAHVASWWDRVQATQDTSPTSSLALLFMANPAETLASVPLPHRARMLLALEEALWSALRDSAGDRADRHALADLGAGMFGVLIPAADAEQAHEQMQRFHLAAHQLVVEVAEQSLHPAFCGSGIAIGTAIGWSGLAEALGTLEKNMLPARQSGALVWFDPSTTGRDQLRRSRALASSIRDACKTPGAVVLRYRPIMPLAAEPLPFYETCVRLRNPEGALLSPSQFEEVVVEHGLGAALDLSVAKSAIAALGAKPGRNHLKLIVSAGAATLKDEASRAEFLTALKPMSTHLVVQVSEALLEQRPDRAQAFRQGLANIGVDLCITDFGAHSDSQGLAERLRPSWVKFAHRWSGETLRQPDEQKAFRLLVSAVHAAGARTVADFVQDSQSMSALFSAGVGYAAGDFLSPLLEGMDAEFTL